MSDLENQEDGTVSTRSEKNGVSPESKAKSNFKLQIIGIFVIALVTFVSIFSAKYYVEKEEHSLQTRLQQQIEILVIERSEIFSTWLSGLVNQSKPITQSDIFRLFAAEVDLAKGDVTAVLEPENDENFQNEVANQVTYKDQLPAMVNALTDLVQDSDYKHSYLIDRGGNAIISSIDATALVTEQKNEALRVFENGVVSYGPFRIENNTVLVDAFVPVYPVQFMEGVDKVVGVFVFTINVTEKLEGLLKANPVSGLAGQYHLFQRGYETEVEEVSAIAPKEIFVSNLPNGIFSDNGLTFADRPAFSGEGNVYSYGKKIEGTDFLLAWQTPAQEARATLDKLTFNVYLIAFTIVLLFMTSFGAFWWRSNSDHNKLLAEQYAKFANRINRQKELLNSINNTIKEYIGLKDKNGKYSYVNPAFAESVGKTVDDVIGLDDEAIFGHGTAQRLKKLDEMTKSSGQSITTIDEVYMMGEKRHLQISKVPVHFDNEDGIVTVTRDITDLVEEQHKREKSIKQTVSALVRAVELRDPHLSGHSKRVSEFATAVAQDISSDIRVKRAVEMAANLSQIGKLDIPNEILTAETRLTEKQQKIMQGHIQSAENILSDIDFDVPVPQAVGQMYERLDGSGYPRGLKEDEICLEARILGVCDYFAARIEPRSYRQAITPSEAIKFLEQNSDKYDPRVVRALRGIVESSTGEKIIASVNMNAGKK